MSVKRPKERNIMRIGIGYDIHKIIFGKKLMLGGVEVDPDRGLLGHSDADVLLHAVTDALLGAAGLGDIGDYFPDTDEKFRDIPSQILLEKVLDMIKAQNYRIVNVDTILIMESPKLGTTKTVIRKKLAKLLGIPRDCVNVKAKSNEGMDDIGRSRAMGAQAVCLIEKIN